MSCRTTYDPCLDGKLNQIGSYASVARQSAESATASAAQSSASAASAQSNATLVQNLYDDFSEKYLGSFATPPLPPITEGALYYNTVSNGLFVWNGTAWISADFNEFTNFTATGTLTARNLVNRMTDFVSPLDFGAVGNGTTDDLAALKLALESGRPVDGGGRTYGINGSLQPISFKGLRNCTLKQLNTASGGANITLRITNIGDFFIDEWNFKVKSYYLRVIQWTENGWRMMLNRNENYELSMLYIIGENCDSEKEATFLIVSDFAKLYNEKKL